MEGILLIVALLIGGLYLYYYPNIDIVLEGKKKTFILWYDKRENGIIQRNYKKLFTI
jgi:hypothetical protein